MWASYTPVFFRYRGVPDELFAAYMLWIPLVAGSLVKTDTARVVTRRVQKRATSGSTANGSSLTIPCLCTTLWLVQGAMFGGIVSDRLVKRKDKNGNKLGPRGRLLVIIVSNLLAAPFAAGALLLPAPTSGTQLAC